MDLKWEKSSKIAPEGGADKIWRVKLIKSSKNELWPFLSFQIPRNNKSPLQNSWVNKKLNLKLDKFLNLAKLENIFL